MLICLLILIPVILFWLYDGRDALKSLFTGVALHANTPTATTRPSARALRNQRPDRFEVRAAALIDAIAVPGKNISELSQFLTAGIRSASNYLWKQFTRSVKALFIHEEPNPIPNRTSDSEPSTHPSSTSI